MSFIALTNAMKRYFETIQSTGSEGSAIGKIIHKTMELAEYG